MNYKEMQGYGLFINLCITIYFFLTLQDEFLIEYTFEWGGQTTEINLLLADFITIVFATLFIAIMIGISIFGSGLNETATRLAMSVLINVTLYTILSYFTISTFLKAGGFGMILYTLLTFIYAIGLFGYSFEQASGRSGGG